MHHDSSVLQMLSTTKSLFAISLIPWEGTLASSQTNLGKNEQVSLSSFKKNSSISRKKTNKTRSVSIKSAQLCLLVNILLRIRDFFFFRSFHFSASCHKEWGLRVYVVLISPLTEIYLKFKHIFKCCDLAVFNAKLNPFRS